MNRERTTNAAAMTYGRGWTFCAVLMLLAGPSAVACKSEVAPHTEGGFRPCPLVDKYPEPNPSAECASPALPLRWDDEQSPTFQAFVKRYLREGSKSQLWLVMGEPGTSGADFEPFVKRFSGRANADVYMMDHRGVGRSEPRLSCPEQQTVDSDEKELISAAEMPACADYVRKTYGDAIYDYTVSAAARDLGEMIERHREPNKQILIYAVSYGTFLTQRYLQQFPDQVDGIFLDSLQSEHAMNHGHMPMGHAAAADQVGRSLFDLCGQDPFCSSKLGDDPNAVTEALYEKLNNGHCPEALKVGVNLNQLKAVLGFFSGQLAFRGAAPSLVHRLNRCGPQDIEPIRYFMNVFHKGPFSGTDFDLLSLLVSANIERSEMWREPAPTMAEHLAYLDTLLYQEYPPVSLVDAWMNYPFLYPHDQYYGKLAKTKIPILAINGTMDASITPEDGRRFGSTLTQPNQNWLTMPNAGHIVLSQSPLVSSPSDTCGWRLAEQFFTDPKASLDLSCLEEVRAPDFSNQTALAYTLYNTSDLYE